MVTLFVMATNIGWSEILNYTITAPMEVDFIEMSPEN